jgi:UDP-2,3-diacylglucosamine hydrolase
VTESIFISDLHLSPERPETVGLFLRFLSRRAPSAHGLYILGDLFDTWIGDDDDTPPYPAVITALRQLSDSGTRLYFQHGNRDFLVGRRFARASGCTLLRDPMRMDLCGTPTLLMHGDLLCTDDIAYQRFRRYARNPLLTRLFQLRSLEARRAIAADYRMRSGAATAAKPAEIMDVNQGAVERCLRRFGARQLIHGHTHRPARHDFLLDGAPATRWVLPEWQGDRGGALYADAQGIRVEELP